MTYYLNNTSPVVQMVQWADGTVWEAPIIKESQNGWVYKPDEARTKSEIALGKNKVFGRGYQGTSKARQWLVEHFQTFPFNKGMPVLVDSPLDIYSVYGNHGGMEVRWNESKTFGWMMVELAYDPDLEKLSFGIAAHPVFWAILRGEFAEMHGSAGLTKWESVSMPKPVVLQVTEKFRENPVQAALWTLGKYPTYPTPAGVPHHKSLLMKALDQIDGPRELAWPEGFGTKEMTDVYRTQVYKDFWLLFDTNAANLVVQNIQPLKDALEALSRLTNIKFRVKQDFHTSQVEEITLELPKDLSRVGREEYHKLTIGLTGVQIQCGFREDERRWIEYEKRRASEFLQELGEMQGPEWTSTVLDIEKE